MKSLLEIQQDIRNLEKSISDVSDSIQAIYSDIEQLRTANQNIDIDYSKIERLAKRFRFGFSKHPINELNDEKACRIYLKLLLSIVRLDSNTRSFFDRLIFIQWIQQEAAIDRPLEDLYVDCYKIQADTYYEMADAITKTYREYFLVDALIIANIDGDSTIDVYEYIAELASILGIGKRKLELLSVIAKAILCQDVGWMKREQMNDKFLKTTDAYRHYIRGRWKSGIRSMRLIIVELFDDDEIKFKWKVEQRQKVKKDDIIATYRRAKRSRRGNVEYITVEIRSPLEGTLFQFKFEHMNYGVLASEVDDVNSIKEWIKNNRWVD